MAKKKKGKTVSVNMAGVEGRGRTVPEGDYTVEVEEVTTEESSSGNPYLNWVLKIAEGESKGSKLWHTTSLQPQALFNLRNTLEALGVEVPDGTLNLDLDEVVGLSMGVTVEHEVYQGKKKARVVEVYSLEGEDGEDGGEGYTQEELEDMEDSELVDIAEELEVEVPYSNKKRKKVDRDALIEALLEAQGDDEDEGDGDEDDGDDEEDFSELSDEELIAKAEELEVDPVYTGKGKKKKLDRDATIEALEEASSDDDEDDGDGDDSDDEGEDLSELSDEELIEKAGEVEVEPIYSGKGKKKKLDREATIAAIEEAEGDDSDGEVTEESLGELDDEELIEKAEEYDVEPTYKGKGSKKKLDRDATIAAILEALDV